jgi:hypothetical protein
MMRVAAIFRNIFFGVPALARPRYHALASEDATHLGPSCSRRQAGMCGNNHVSRLCWGKGTWARASQLPSQAYGVSRISPTPLLVMRLVLVPGYHFEPYDSRFETG